MNARARCRSLAARTKLERDQIHALLQPERQVVLVLLAQGRRRNGHAREVDPLVLLQDAALDDLERRPRTARCG